MANLQYFYKKHQKEFEVLENRCLDLFDGNPWEYEQHLAASTFVYGRDGLHHSQTVDYVDGEMVVGEKIDVAPLPVKLKINRYWEQRDKVDKILREDQEFKKFSKTRKSHEGNGLDAFFWYSHFAIKYKIYPLDFSR